MLGSVNNLEAAIRRSLRVPPELQSHFIMNTTGLGGVFLEYYSNNAGGVATMNSHVQFSISFDTTDGMGRYVGDNIGVSMHRYYNIKPFRAVKTKQPYQKVVEKINNWILANQAFLVSVIEN